MKVAKLFIVTQGVSYPIVGRRTGIYRRFAGLNFAEQIRELLFCCQDIPSQNEFQMSR